MVKIPSSPTRGVLAVAVALVTHSALALTFNFTNGGGVPANFMTAAVAAGNLWSGYFTDPIQLNITLNYNLGEGEVGASSAGASAVAYAIARQALISDVVSSADLSATSFLQTSAPVQFLINRTLSDPLRMDTGTSGTSADNNNTQLIVHRALSKALGLIAGNDVGSDGSLNLNPSLSYDIDRSDGIGASSYDLIGVIAHELGHIMGFQTLAEAISVSGNLTAEGSSLPRLADLFRFSSASTDPSGAFAGSGAGPGVFDVSADNRSKYFSIDGGTTAVAEFARGSSSAVSGFGNGQQANHWLNNASPIGLMDPTIGLGELLSFTAVDRQFFDVIGYNPVPEAGTWASGIALVGGFWILRRRSRRAA